MSRSKIPHGGAATSDTARVLERGDVKIDFGQHVITIGGKVIDLSATEYELMAHLANAAPQVVSAQELAAQAQGYGGQSLQEANATLRYHFYRIRRKIKKATGREDLIKTVHGVGYTLYERPSAELPFGAVTFLYTLIQNSTRLWELYPLEMKAALGRHDAILRQTIESFGGYIFKGAGDMFCAAFSLPFDAVSAALAVQRALQAELWATPLPILVRTALHTGLAELTDGEYYGVTLNVANRLVESGHGGQILISEATHEHVARRLPPETHIRDLGTRRLRGVKEPTHIYQLVAQDLPAQFPPLETMDPRTTNLPGQLTLFVGRERDTRQVTQRLRRSDVRLLTLTGTGGAGKTRLALHVAGQMVDEYQDGVFFVSLASIHQTEFVPSAVGRALGLQPDAEAEGAAQVFEHLKNRRALLLLDNFEQVLDAAPFVTDLLRHAPHMQVLVTSREALHVYGEHLYPVAPLTTPDGHSPLTMGQLELYEGTKLFVERASAMLPNKVFTDADATTIGAICACLDGLPLAIELAAARASELSLQDISAQLNSRLGFLSKGPRDLPARHQTLRGLLDWSYHLLTESERAMFARLAVFGGGWTSDAALHVTTWDGDESAIDKHVQDGLAAKFLIQPAAGTFDPPRLTMLETIREYAGERLKERGELGQLRRSLANYLTHLLKQLEPELIGGQRQKYALWVCEAEQYNFRAALDWTREAGENEIALDMVKTLWRFWGISSQLTEGRERIEGILGESHDAPPALRAPVLYGLSKLAMFQGDFGAAEDAAKQALALYQELGDDDGIGWSTNALGEIASSRNETEQAKAYFDAGLDLHRRVNNKLGIAKAMDDLGRLAIKQEDYTRAAELLEESLRLRRERGSPEGIAVGLVTLGEVMRLQHDYEAAERYTSESLARYRQLNHTAGIITCLYNLAQLHQAENESRQAIGLYLEALGLLRDMEREESDLVLSCLAGLAQALYSVDELYHAAQAIGALEQLSEDLGAEPDESELPTEMREMIRDILGERDWAQARASGRTLSPEEFAVAVTSPGMRR